ncbi:thioredoxin family protein [Halomonas sp. AOP13-D3-9]
MPSTAKTPATCTDPAAIMGYKVMATPGIAIDGKLVHSGGVPVRHKIESLLKA